MSAKALVFLGMIIGSAIGAYIPLIWGSSLLSYSSVLFSGIGGILGIWIGFKLSD